MSENRQVRVALAGEVTEGAARVVTAGDTAIALFRVEGVCYAIANACPHRGGPLGEGDIEGSTVHCPWHGWTWDVRTGVNVRQPKLKVACFPVTERDGEVFVEIASPAASSVVSGP